MAYGGDQGRRGVHMPRREIIARWAMNPSTLSATTTRLHRLMVLLRIEPIVGRRKRGRRELHSITTLL